jgi:signal transduction histidine kinase/CheY-like chemotaxis protein
LLDDRVIRTFDRPIEDGGLVVLRVDITEEKRREGAIIASRDVLARQTQELIRVADSEKRANNEKSVFLATMSHEIRTPLNAVFGFSSLLSRTQLNETQREYVTFIESSSHHLKALVNDILDFTKIEGGKLELLPGPFDLRALTTEVRDLTVAMVAGKPIEVVLRMDAGVPANIVGDSVRLRQILTNLTGNAAKFTSAGSIAIVVEDLGESGGKQLVRFTVEDTGPGIASDELASIFNSFEQGVAGRALGKGSGLGLSISRSLALLMGGRLAVEPGRASGARLTLELPFEADVTVDKQARKAPAEAQSASLDILVAEDSIPSRLLVEILLRQRGHKVVSVDNGELAVAAARAQRFDLAILDLQMPKIDGLTAARMMRALPKEVGPLRILALTAQAFSDDRKAAADAGMDGFLAKPFGAEEFDKLIADLGFHAKAVTVEAA